METIIHSVLVGVTAENENSAALRFALNEARLLGCGVTLVHAAHPMLPPPPPSVLITDDTWSEVGSMVVADARDELARLAGDDGVPLGTVVRQGRPAEVFSELSRNARMIVLQHRVLSPLRRVVISSTVASVARHAHCPVVSVPEGSSADSVTHVTVGVHGDGGPRPVLEAGFAEASLRGGAVRVVHAWRPTGGDDLLFPADAQWSAQDQAVLAAAVEELVAKYPDVGATINARQDEPADALLKAVKRSGMVVVGRHSGLPILPKRLGHVARSVVSRAARPVMVVPL